MKAEEEMTIFLINVCGNKKVKVRKKNCHIGFISFFSLTLSVIQKSFIFRNVIIKAKVEK